MSVHYGTRQPHQAPLGPLASPLIRATSHAMRDAEEIRAHGAGEKVGDFYPRYSHSNGRELESRLAELEATDGAVAFASGMAAITGAILAHCGAGDRVLVAEQVYGGTDVLARHELPRLGLVVERFDALDLGTLEHALARPAKLVVTETPINPTLRVVDVQALAALCRARGALSFVDGTFAPPPIQQTCALGADLVMHSATKFLGGHCDVLAGIVAGSHAVLGPIERFRRRTGGVIAPDLAWLLCRSLTTLALRVEAQQAAALRIASALAEDAGPGRKVVKVNYPGLPSHPDHALALRQMRGGGGLVTFELAGGLAAAVATYDRFRVVARAPSLGGCETVASLPLHTTHAGVPPADRARAGIGDGMIRISVGLEGAEVLLEDIRTAIR